MSGKTTNLEIVHQRAPDQNRGDLTSISTDGDRTLFFDFMPLDLGTVAGMRTSFQIYTVPGQVYYNSTRKLVLQGCDGVVFVADSSANMVEENLESLRNLEENLKEYGKSLATTPHVIQFNKRDLPDALPAAEMNAQLNKYGAPSFEAVANTGQGVFPTLKALAAAVLDSIHQSSGGGASGAGDPKRAAMPAPPAPAAPALPSAPAASVAAMASPPQAAAQPPVQQPPAALPLSAAHGQPAAVPVAPPPAAPLGRTGIQANPPRELAIQPGFRPQAQPSAGYSRDVSNTGFNPAYTPDGSPSGSATIIDGGLQMSPGQPSGSAYAAPTRQQAPPTTALRPAPHRAPEPASPRSPAPAPSALEGTRFKPRMVRPAASPTPVRKSGNSLFTGLFIAAALVVGAVLVRVLISFF
jgi:hypothetical protein